MTDCDPTNPCPSGCDRCAHTIITPEVEQAKRKSNLDDPTWSPNCLNCRTMDRMVRSPEGFYCRSCHMKLDAKLAPIPKPVVVDFRGEIPLPSRSPRTPGPAMALLSTMAAALGAPYLPREIFGGGRRQLDRHPDEQLEAAAQSKRERKAARRRAEADKREAGRRFPPPPFGDGRVLCNRLGCNPKYTDLRCLLSAGHAGDGDAWYMPGQNKEQP